MLANYVISQLTTHDQGNLSFFHIDDGRHYRFRLTRVVTITIWKLVLLCDLYQCFFFFPFSFKFVIHWFGITEILWESFVPSIDFIVYKTTPFAATQSAKKYQIHFQWPIWIGRLKMTADDIAHYLNSTSALRTICR